MTNKLEKRGYRGGVEVRLHRPTPTVSPTPTIFGVPLVRSRLPEVKGFVFFFFYFVVFPQVKE